MDDFRRPYEEDDDPERLRILKATAWFLRANRRVLESTGMKVGARLAQLDAKIADFGAAVERRDGALDAKLHAMADVAEKDALIIQYADQLEALTPEQWQALPTDEREKLQAMLPELRAARDAILADRKRNEPPSTSTSDSA